MADFTIELTDESKRQYKKSINAYFKQSKSATLEVFKITALKILSSSISNLQKHDNIASGKLAKNGRFSKEQGKDNYQVVYTGYAGAVEFGRKAGRMPPVDIITQWVRRKLRVRDNKKAKSIGFAIAKSIARNGTKAYPFLAPAYEKEVKGLRNRIIVALNNVNK